MPLDEVQTSHPQAVLTHSLNVPTSVYCDALRVSQLLSNLLGNAVTRGAAATPISVHAYTDDDELVISEANQGAPVLWS